MIAHQATVKTTKPKSTRHKRLSRRRHAPISLTDDLNIGDDFDYNSDPYGRDDDNPFCSDDYIDKLCRTASGNRADYDGDGHPYGEDFCLSSGDRSVCHSVTPTHSMAESTQHQRSGCIKSATIIQARFTTDVDENAHVTSLMGYDISQNTHTILLMLGQMVGDPNRHWVELDFDDDYYLQMSNEEQCRLIETLHAAIMADAIGYFVVDKHVWLCPLQM